MATISTIQTLDSSEEDPGFEIIHLSFRKRTSEGIYGGPVDYYIGNIVFRLTNEEAKGRMEYILSENERVRVAPDEELHDKYYDGLSFNLSDACKEEEAVEDENGEKFYPVKITNKHNLEDEDVFIWAYRRNMDPMHSFVEYIEKFDCYRMHEYFQDTPVVRGIIQYLQDMKDGKPNPSRTVYHEQFLTTLTNLCWWWD
jgi:hypothetical protein